jgi:hypothetical protein
MSAETDLALNSLVQELVQHSGRMPSDGIRRAASATGVGHGIVHAYVLRRKATAMQGEERARAGRKALKENLLPDFAVRPLRISPSFAIVPSEGERFVKTTGSSHPLLRREGLPGARCRLHRRDSQRMDRGASKKENGTVPRTCAATCARSGTAPVDGGSRSVFPYGGANLGYDPRSNAAIEFIERTVERQTKVRLL